MPILKSNNYSPRFPFKNAHIHTIYPSLFRKVAITFNRKRIDTPDGDFFDVDTVKKGSEKAVILLHGLEGSSDSNYIKGMAKAAIDSGHDAIALNFRGCSGEVNKVVRSYHSGETEDLHLLIKLTLKEGNYKRLHLIGFSLGANVILKYLGEVGEAIDSRIRSAVSISVPCELAACSDEISKPVNWIYSKRFLSDLKEKVKLKRAITKDVINYEKVMASKGIWEFDDNYTAPIHGFESAEAYYETCSGNRFLHNIRIPTLILNALDDTFLAGACYPYELAKESKFVFLETPEYGGHVGFVGNGRKGWYWSEERAMSFLE